MVCRTFPNTRDFIESFPDNVNDYCWTLAKEMNSLSLFFDENTFHLKTTKKINAFRSFWIDEFSFGRIFVQALEGFDKTNPFLVENIEQKIKTTSIQPSSTSVSSLTSNIEQDVEEIHITSPVFPPVFGIEPPNRCKEEELDNTVSSSLTSNIEQDVEEIHITSPVFPPVFGIEPPNRCKEEELDNTVSSSLTSNIEQDVEEIHITSPVFPPVFGIEPQNRCKEEELDNTVSSSLTSNIEQDVEEIHITSPVFPPVFGIEPQNRCKEEELDNTVSSSSDICSPIQVFPQLRLAPDSSEGCILQPKDFGQSQLAHCSYSSSVVISIPSFGTINVNDKTVVSNDENPRINDILNRTTFKKLCPSDDQIVNPKEQEKKENKAVMDYLTSKLDKLRTYTFSMPFTGFNCLICTPPQRPQFYYCGSFSKDGKDFISAYDEKDTFLSSLPKQDVLIFKDAEELILFVKNLSKTEGQGVIGVQKTNSTPIVVKVYNDEYKKEYDKRMKQNELLYEYLKIRNRPT